MTLAQLLAFNLALFAAIFSPGPALLVAVRTTLTGGRLAGLAVGAGLGRDGIDLDIVGITRCRRHL